MVLGHVSLIRDIDQLVALADSPSWVPGRPDHVVRVKIERSPVGASSQVRATRTADSAMTGYCGAEWVHQGSSSDSAEPA